MAIPGASHRRRLSASLQCKFDQRLLLQFMRLGRAGGWAGCRGAFHAEHLAVGEDSAQPWDHKPKRAHIGRLFLHPDNFVGSGMRVGGRLETTVAGSR